MAMLATSISALPLNINLGAYSPALVVGDGEISFGGKADVSNLMNALEGAAVTGAATNGAAAQGQAGQGQAGQAGAAPATTAAAGQAATEGKTEAKTEPAQVTALQGMGKEIAPRIVKLERNEVEEVAKRDIQTLNAALNYAAGAIKTGPEVQLGTEAAGVGILVKAGSTANGGAAAAGAGKIVMGKRENAPTDSKMKTTVTTMFIRGGPAGKLLPSSFITNQNFKTDVSAQ